MPTRRQFVNSFTIRCPTAHSRKAAEVTEKPALQIETLFVVEGRRGEGTPPGVAVLPPPLRRARSRGEDAFLLLIDLGEETPSSLYRRLREAVAQAFWTTEGSVTAALRRAVGAANHLLFQANLEVEPEHRRYGGITCVALRGEEVFLAQAGPTWAVALCGGLMESFPREDLSPLGMAAYADVRLNYLTCGLGDVLLVSTPWLSRAAPAEVLRQILSRPMDALLDGVEQVGAEEDFAAVAVRWEVAPTPEPVERETPAERPAPPPRPKQPRRRWKPPRVTLPQPPVGRWLRAAGKGAAAGIATVMEGGKALFRRMLPGRAPRPSRPRRRRASRPLPAENPRLMAGIALAIPLVVVVVTVWAWIAYGNTMHHREALEQAQACIQEAEAIADPTVAREQWKRCLGLLEDIGDTPEVAAMRGQVQAALDALDRVRWVEPILIWDFGEGFQPRRLVVHEPFLFVLDEAGGNVYQLTLNGTRDGLQEQGEPVVFLEQGQVVDRRGVARLVDVVWASAEGGRTSDGLLALEEGETLITSDAWGVQRITLATAPDQGPSVAMAAFDGRLYLLDPTGNQIWRYLPEGKGYPGRPEPYFAVSPPRPLDEARDLAIDGNVYVLFDDGTVEKFFKGEGTEFAVVGVPEPEPRFVAVAVDPGQQDGFVTLVDAVGERLVVLQADGRFVEQIRAREDAFRSIQAVALDPLSGRLYVLAGGRLYALP